MKLKGGRGLDEKVASGLEEAEGVEGVWVYRKPDGAALESGETITQSQKSFSQLND